MFGIDGEALGKILGGGAAAFAIGLLTWLGNRKNKADAAEKSPTPAGMGIMLDGDTATALLREAKAIRDDLERWRTEDLSRAKDDEIADLKGQLATASGTTHDNQADIRRDIEELKRMMADLKMH